MNETQIIQKQLAVERLHFAEVANTCARAIDAAAFPSEGEFARACAEYFAFAITRLDPGSREELAAKLQMTRSTDSVTADSRWREFLKLFNGEAAQHFTKLDAFSTRHAPVTHWRAQSRVDADSIFTERALFERVKSTLPAGLAHAALSAFLP